MCTREGLGALVKDLMTHQFTAPFVMMQFLIMFKIIVVTR